MQGQDPNDDDHFEVQTKMPPLNKPPKQPAHSPDNHPHKNYDPVNWDQFYDELFYLDDGTSVFRAGSEGALFFCIHGAGQSAQSFAALAREVKHFGTVVSFDFKGHGYSKKEHDNTDLSIQALCAETIETLKQILQRFSDKNVIIVGHSLGGSVCARVTDTLINVEKLQRIVGCIVIDVVQGTAIQALPFMNQIIQDRPKHFESPEAAIKWSYGSCTLRKLESAKVSIPPQLVKYEKKGQTRYGWKVNLKQTEKYWMGTFCAYLDKELTIAQMQGKFKLVVLHNVGHSVQEDDYKGTAKEFYSFVKDFRIPMTLQEQAEKELVGIANFHPHLQKY